MSDAGVPDPPQPAEAPRRPLRITRVYTRVGDGGQTQISGGRWISKSHPRLEAFGTVDELQVAIAAARDAFSAIEPLPGRMPNIARHLAYIQNLLFTLNGDLATPVEDRWDAMPLIVPDNVVYLEGLIDAYNADLPPLTDFILPGGHPAPTALHGCRVVCRRAERAIDRLAAVEAVGEPVRPFINRLSDTFFVLARSAGAELRGAGVPVEETIWRRDEAAPPVP
jgi:cob(I)alamin adenosyltransferase